MMRVAFLVVDDRFDRDLPRPFFGSAPSALLEGFARMQTGERIQDSGTRMEGVELHVICCVKKPVPAPQKLAENIWYHQIVLPPWSFLRSAHLGPVLGVHKLLNTIRPDVIHAQGTERWCAISAALTKYPKVLTIHGNLRLINKITPMEPRMYWKAQEFLETFAIPRFDGVVCITNYTRENVSDLARRTWVIPNAVDGSFFELGKERLKVNGPVDSSQDSRPVHPSSRILSPASPRTILVVAHVQPRKNQNAFIDAIASLADKHGFRVRFFGRASAEKDFMVGFQNRMRDHSWCSFEGMIGRDELREAFRTADLLVLPSLEDNCPMSVLEAMAACVPVVASDVGGIPDLVTDDLNGLLCNPNSKESMRDCVDRVFSDPGLASRLSRKAFQLAWERFHPISIAKRHIEVYREVAEKKLRAKKRI